MLFLSSNERGLESSLKMPSTTGARGEHSYTENVIRDKNTIVQITVHTKPKDKVKVINDFN